MRKLFFISVTVLTAFTVQAADKDYLSDLENAVVKELNLARTNPAAYARLIDKEKKFYKGKIIRKPGRIAMMTREGLSAVNEASKVLKKQKALPAFSVAEGLSKAAADHAREQSKTGATGHSGRGGSTPFQRMNRYGSWQHTAGENISYGFNEGRDVVMQLIIDDGVPSRGHRENIYNKEFKVIGVGCDKHPKFRFVCVIDFAGGYKEK